MCADVVHVDIHDPVKTYASTPDWNLSRSAACFEKYPQSLRPKSSLSSSSKRAKVGILQS